MSPPAERGHWIRSGVIVLLGLAALALVAGASYLRAVRWEVADATSYFSTLMELRRSALEDYLKTIRSEVVLWSGQSAVREALAELEQGWRQIPGDPSVSLQRLYIEENPFPVGERHRLEAGDGSAYGLAHAHIHPWMGRFLENQGYYDVFLVDPSGNLVYTAFKERDFATNLESGPWRDTGLGAAFRAARDAEGADYVAFTDFGAYEPSNGEPASFVASPVRSPDGGSLGVLAFQVPVEAIDRIMQFTGGMGESGETYIVGEDLLMRSDSRFSEESTILRTRVDTETVRRALAGETGVDITDDYRGVPVISAYGPLDFEGLRWAVMAEIDEAEVRRRALEPRRLLANTLLALGVIAALGALVLTWAMARRERPEPWKDAA